MKIVKKDVDFEIIEELEEKNQIILKIREEKDKYREQIKEIRHQIKIERQAKEDALEELERLRQLLKERSKE